MGWTYDEIEREWLAGGVIAVSAEEAVMAFDRCELVLGREWINQSRGKMVGALPTLHVVATGQRLAALDGLGNTDALIKKLRKDDPSAAAELHAIYMLRSSNQISVELFPKVISGNREREADFRIRLDRDHPWVYVEVTQTDKAKSYEQMEVIFREICEVIHSVLRPFDLEVFLRRRPTATEVAAIITHSIFLLGDRESGREELPDNLGVLFLASSPTRPIVPDDHGEEVVPRLGKANVIATGDGSANRRIVVRIPYADERAEKFFHREASQLPVDEPGLVMVDMRHATAGFSSWERLIMRRFQPNVSTRVGAVCLFSCNTVLTENGFSVLSETKLLANPHARIPLPDWVGANVAAAGAEFKAIIAHNITKSTA